VGKAREHEKYERWRQDGRLDSKLTRKSLTDEQIRGRVLDVTKRGKVPLRTLRYVLGLSVSTWARLNEIVAKLEQEGRVRIINLPEGKSIEAIE
jgi:hypothetical protein